MTAHLPTVDLVILAGGQAVRMGGENKLLQNFDGEPQLLKIINQLCTQVARCLVNSHRDHASYQSMVSDIQCFTDAMTGFCGPLAGMKTAWSFAKADYVLFVPCDITWIPPQLVEQLLVPLIESSQAKANYAIINGDALYPLCLMHRSAEPVLQEYLDQQQFSLHRCFGALGAGFVSFSNPQSSMHSINSISEMEVYRQPAT
jgi:molybdopterin-guanine dinucleotide biosynthesis protein A